MKTVSPAHHLLTQAAAILPSSDEELIYKGIAAGVSERILDLKKAAARLREVYGSYGSLGAQDPG